MQKSNVSQNLGLKERKIYVVDGKEVLMTDEEIELMEQIEDAKKRTIRSDRFTTFALVLSIIALAFNIFCLFI